LGPPAEHAQNQWETIVSDTTADLRALADPRSVEETIKDAIARAAERAGLAYWRAFDIWYGKARYVRDFEKEAIVKALIEKKRLETRNELHELKTRLAVLERRLLQVDSDFHCENADQIRQQVRGAGGLDRAGNR
jgi:hypothetical protein